MDTAWRTWRKVKGCRKGCRKEGLPEAAKEGMPDIVNCHCDGTLLIDVFCRTIDGPQHDAKEG